MPRTTEQKAQQQKIYRYSPAGIKTSKVSSWKSQGMIDEDLHAVYDYYLKETNCMVCLEEFKNSRDKCLDHDHETGEIRYICCNYCNRHVIIDKNKIHTKPSIDNACGHLNICWKESKKRWKFSKMINGIRHEKKGFHTLAEAVQYKIDNNY